MKPATTKPFGDDRVHRFVDPAKLGVLTRAIGPENGEAGPLGDEFVTEPPDSKFECIVVGPCAYPMHSGVDGLHDSALPSVANAGGVGPPREFGEMRFDRKGWP